MPRNRRPVRFRNNLGPQNWLVNFTLDGVKAAADHGHAVQA